ncbi:MAG: hypothetical protein AAGG01_19395, partial [Planctomycetota bacterium]
INDPAQLLESEFQEVFGDAFSCLRFTPPVTIHVETFIQRMEDMGDELQSLDFDTSGTRCSLRLRGVEARIEVTATNVLIQHDRSKDPRALIEAFSESQRLLIETQAEHLLEFER